MNRPRPFTSPGKLFKPAIQYLSALTNPDSSPSKHHQRPHRRSTSLDEPFPDSPRRSHPDTMTMPARSSRRSRASSSSASSAAELQLTAIIPLIDISRSPSPYARNRSSGAQSEDDEEDDEEMGVLEPVSSAQPLVAADVGVGRRGWRKVVREGGVGRFLFGTWVGWQVYVAVLVVWVGGCGVGLLMMNRLILLTGVYKFPYPLTATLLQLIFTHILLLGWSSVSRALARPLRNLGLGGAIAPAYPASTGAPGHRGSAKNRLPLLHLCSWIWDGTGGIAGGGIFEFDRTTALQVLPLAAVYVGKVVLSNISFAYAVLPVYALARIAIVPLSLILTAVLTRTTHSIPTLSSSLTATLNLLIASIRPGVRVTWESILAGASSSLFVALYPILLQRTHARLTTRLLSHQADPFASATADDPTSTPSNEETRAYYQTLHYTSLLSLLPLLPLVALSGEVANIRHNCYFLDVAWFWFLVACGGVTSWAVFASTLLLVRATSPLAATFVGVPRAALQLVALSGGRMPVHSWVGVALCWVGSAWFVAVRRREGRGWERGRLGGG